MYALEVLLGRQVYDGVYQPQTLVALVHIAISPSSIGIDDGEIG